MLLPISRCTVRLTDALQVRMATLRSVQAQSGTQVTGRNKCAHCLDAEVYAPHLRDSNRCTCPIPETSDFYRMTADPGEYEGGDGSYVSVLSGRSISTVPAQQAAVDKRNSLAYPNSRGSAVATGLTAIATRPRNSNRIARGRYTPASGNRRRRRAVSDRSRSPPLEPRRPKTSNSTPRCVLGYGFPTDFKEQCDRATDTATSWQGRSVNLLESLTEVFDDYFKNHTSLKIELVMFKHRAKVAEKFLVKVEESCDHCRKMLMEISGNGEGNIEMLG
jgi:hypothetical protein